jgi:hypothetical protein
MGCAPSAVSVINTTAGNVAHTRTSMEATIIPRSTTPGLDSQAASGQFAHLPTPAASLSKELAVSCPIGLDDENPSPSELSHPGGNAQKVALSQKAAGETTKTQSSVPDASSPIISEPMKFGRRNAAARDHPLFLGPEIIGNTDNGPSGGSRDSHGSPFPLSLPLVLQSSTSEPELLVADPTPRSGSSTSLDLLLASTGALTSDNGFRPNPLASMVRSMKTQCESGESQNTVLHEEDE